MSQQIGWSVEAKLLYQIKQLTKALSSRSYIQTYANFASFPNPGITGTLYVDEATGDIYVWNGTSYVLLSSGITALNGLIAAAQLLTTGTSGTDFNISSVGTTHTFNIPTASASNRGLLSSADWTTFNNKPSGTGTTNYVSKFTGASTLGNSQIFDNGTNVGINTNTPAYKLDVNGTANISGTTNLLSSVNIGSANSVTINAGSAATPLIKQTANYTELYKQSGGVAIYLGGSGDPANYYDNTSHYFRNLGGSVTYVTINSSGNVGIGTTSPTPYNAGAKVLQIHSPNNFSEIKLTNLISGSGGSQGMLLTSINTNAYVWNSSNGDLILASNNLERLRVFSTGNVRIASSFTDSGELLQVDGTARVTQSAYFATASGNAAVGTINANFGGFSKCFSINRTVSPGTTGLEFLSSDVAEGYIFTRSGGSDGLTIQRVGINPILFITNSAERLRIFGNGNVRIASSFTDSGELLQVAGTASVTQSAYFATSSGSVGIGTVNLFSKLTILENVSGITHVKAPSSYFYSLGFNGNNSYFTYYSQTRFIIGYGSSTGGSPSVDTMVLDINGNVGLNQTIFGSSATRTFAISNGTAPASSPGDCFQLYSADITAGNAAPHFRTENGAVVKVYQETTAVAAAALVSNAGTAITSTDTFDGYTLQQIVKALRNQGLLA